MLLQKHLEHLLAAHAAELVGPVRTGEGGYSTAKRKTAEIAELFGVLHLFAGAEGFDIRDNAPPVDGVDGGRKRRLPSSRKSIADLFEKGPF
jgi:hypothetical protein